MAEIEEMTPKERLEKEVQVAVIRSLEAVQDLDISTIAKFLGPLSASAAIAETWLERLENPTQKQVLGLMFATNLQKLTQLLLKSAGVE